jgi:leucyl-tRNA synthetase
MPHIIDKKNPPKPGKKQIERRTIHALVRDPKTGKFLGLKWKKHPWTTFIVGGVEEGEDPVVAAKREVEEETGYTDIKFVRTLGGPVRAEYFAAHKDVNRIAVTTAVLFDLVSETRHDVSGEEESAHEPIWLSRSEMTPEIMTCAELPVWLERLGDAKVKDETKPLLDWPESIKKLQRDWIGRSEGAHIVFKIKGLSDEIKVFTTRPDTLFGVTYVVLAPEHELVAKLLDKVSNKKEVETYIKQSALETVIERTDAKRDKTGVELRGITVTNPANGEDVPVWVAGYVLADYGTGAVMAVPAHDERDWQFAKKYGLNIRDVILPVEGTPHAGSEFRKTVSSIVKRKSDGKYLALKWKKFDWISVPIGGIEGDESPMKTAEREVLEETGYKTRAVGLLGGQIESHFFAENKNVWRHRLDQPVLLELIEEPRSSISEDELSKHESVWMTGEELIEKMTHKYNAIGLERHMKGNDAYTSAGKLINSGKYNGLNSETVKAEITRAVGGEWVTTYKLRDWVFSRQRYWGEPIPLIHCEDCGVVPVPDKDLPVRLPKVKSYEPTGTGESPLAAIKKWVNVKCPKCKGPGKRETNTMPQWAGSSWYYLRYMDPKNSKKIADPKKEKFWSPVDLYVGGAEHATRHLIYARFWHKVLFDIGAVFASEPFKKLQHVGLIIGEDGRKMSKRFGNVVNPDDIVKQFGADTLRVYEMFMGPFDQQISWSTSSMVGSRRFVEKIYRLRAKVVKDRALSAETMQAHKKGQGLLHKTIHKVTEDISDFRLNTAISSMMILVNKMESATLVTQSEFESVLKLLAPFAPHVADFLWQDLGNKKSIHISNWPEFDPTLTIDSETKIIVQVNGKVRGSFMTGSGTDRLTLENTAKNMPEIQKWTAGKNISKVIVIEDRLVNIVVAGLI